MMETIGYLAAERFYRCIACGQAFVAEDWQYGEVPCDDCGSHGGVMCPNEECWEIYDSVYRLPELVAAP